jgi:tRNA A37 threonylcarbamoyladenosine modification protein TsaB
MNLLALDQASHTTGYAIFKNDKPVVISHFNAKGKDIAERLVSIR